MNLYNKLTNRFVAKRDANKFMAQFSRPTEMKLRKAITRVLAHANGHKWRSTALAQEKELKRYRDLFHRIVED